MRLPTTPTSIPTPLQLAMVPKSSARPASALSDATFTTSKNKEMEQDIRPSSNTQGATLLFNGKQSKDKGSRGEEQNSLAQCQL